MSKPYMEACMRDVLGYLRGKHFYCLYCRVQYKSNEELEEKCPGVTEATHEDISLLENL